MKIKRKYIYALDDAFRATEGRASVSITRHRHTVIVEVTAENGNTNTKEMSLKRFAEVLCANRLMP